MYQRELFAERLLSAREQKQVAARLHSLGAVAVQLDLPKPFRAFGQFGNREAFHWLDESGPHSHRAAVATTENSVRKRAVCTAIDRNACVPSIPERVGPTRVGSGRTTA